MRKRRPYYKCHLLSDFRKKAAHENDNKCRLSMLLHIDVCIRIRITCVQVNSIPWIDYILLSVLLWLLNQQHNK